MGQINMNNPIGQKIEDAFLPSETQAKMVDLIDSRVYRIS